MFCLACVNPVCVVHHRFLQRSPITSRPAHMFNTCAHTSLQAWGLDRLVLDNAWGESVLRSLLRSGGTDLHVSFAATSRRDPSLRLNVCSLDVCTAWHPRSYVPAQLHPTLLVVNVRKGFCFVEVFVCVLGGVINPPGGWWGWSWFRCLGVPVARCGGSMIRCYVFPGIRVRYSPFVFLRWGVHCAAVQAIRSRMRKCWGFKLSHSYEWVVLVPSTTVACRTFKNCGGWFRVALFAREGGVMLQCTASVSPRVNAGLGTPRASHTSCVRWAPPEILVWTKCYCGTPHPVSVGNPSGDAYFDRNWKSNDLREASVQSHSHMHSYSESLTSTLRASFRRGRGICMMVGSALGVRQKSQSHFTLQWNGVGRSGRCHRDGGWWWAALFEPFSVRTWQNSRWKCRSRCFQVACSLARKRKKSCTCNVQRSVICGTKSGRRDLARPRFWSTGKQRNPISDARARSSDWGRDRGGWCTHFTRKFWRFLATHLSLLCAKRVWPSWMVSFSWSLSRDHCFQETGVLVFSLFPVVFNGTACIRASPSCWVNSWSHPQHEKKNIERKRYSAPRHLRQPHVLLLDCSAGGLQHVYSNYFQNLRPLGGGEEVRTWAGRRDWTYWDSPVTSDFGSCWDVHKRSTRNQECHEYLRPLPHVQWTVRNSMEGAMNILDEGWRLQLRKEPKGSFGTLPRTDEDARIKLCSIPNNILDITLHRGTFSQLTL